MTDEDVTIYRLKKAEQLIAELDATVRGLEGNIADMKRHADQLEKQRLRWGISALGTVVMLLGTIIWGYRGVIFK